jgi:hypothetical protein
MELAKEILTHRGLVRGNIRVHWYVLAYLLSPTEYKRKLARFLNKNQEYLITFYSFMFSKHSGLGDEKRLDTINYLSDTIVWLGQTFPPFYRGSDVSQEGNKKANISGLISSQISKMAKDISLEGYKTLDDLAQNNLLIEWKEHLLHAQAVQARELRNAVFRFPTVDQVVKTLEHGPPANTKDLKAVVVDWLENSAKLLRDGPTDGYKIFWNKNSYGKPTIPQPENTDRDSIITVFGRDLTRLGIDVTSEGTFANNKRADIRISYDGKLILPVEIKRHYHADLWSAPLNQLYKKYSRDPGADGQGIYLVLWFGLDKKRRIPKLPPGIKKPTTPESLKIALETNLPFELRTAIDVVILDLSTPAEKTEKTIN